MAVYVLAQVKIQDAAGFAAYAAAFGPTIGPFEGRVLAVDDDPDVLDGEWPEGRSVVIEFPSHEQARAWYDSEPYQAASELRRAASISTMAVVAGYPRAGQ